MHSPRGVDQRAVQVDAGLGEERGGLPGPDLAADVVEDVEQRVDVLGLEAAAEVAGRGRVGNAAGAEGVEEDFVVAAQFDVLQAGAVAQGVVGEVEHVIGLVVGQVDLEQVQAAVDGVDEAELAGQQVDGADAAVADAAAALGDFVVDVAGGEHGLGTAAQVALVEAVLDAALAAGQFLSYAGVHSKSLRSSGAEER